MKKQFLVLLAIATLSFALAVSAGLNTAGAAGPKYPTKAISLVVPWSPGGGADLTARAMATIAPKYLGQQLIVVQKPGAAGVTGHTEVAKTRHDGYTLIITGNSPSTVVPHLGTVEF